MDKNQDHFYRLQVETFIMKIEGAIKDYTGKDLARTFKQLQPSPERKSALINQDFTTLMSEGYVMIENLLTPSQCAQIKNQCMPLMSHTGRNNFEGEKTQRLYNVLGKTRCIDRLADHPRILGLMDLLFRPNYLLSQSQVINIHLAKANRHFITMTPFTKSLDLDPP